LIHRKAKPEFGVSKIIPTWRKKPEHLFTATKPGIVGREVAYYYEGNSGDFASS
jgi:hypothetical protein